MCPLVKVLQHWSLQKRRLQSPASLNNQHHCLAIVFVMMASLYPCPQINRGKVMEELQALDKLTKELRAIDRTLSLVLKSQEEASKPRYWTRVAKRLNKAFFVFYVTVVIAFLIFIFKKWSDALV